jgi:hypothetical protein
VVGEPSNSLQQYAIQLDFTNNYGLAIPNPGDVQTAQIIARTFNQLDARGGQILDGSVGARVYRNANLSIANNVALATAIDFTTARFDSNSCWSGANPTRLTCNTAGKYVIVGAVQFAANASGVRRLLLRINGTLVIAADLRNPVNSATINTELTVSAIYNLAAGDYVEMVVTQNSGAALNVLSTGSLSPELMMVLAINASAAGGGMSNPMTTLGDLISGGSGGSPLRLSIGTPGQVLTVVSGSPVWSAPTGGMSNPMTTPNDLIIGGTAGAPVRLAKGTNGQVLTVDSSGNVNWSAPTGGMSNPMTQAGDIVFGGTPVAGVAPPTRLAKGADGQALVLVSGLPAWGTVLVNPMTASGDIIYGGTAGAPTKLVKASDGQVLTLAGGVPSWATPGAAADQGQKLQDLGTVSAGATINSNIVGHRHIATIKLAANGSAPGTLYIYDYTILRSSRTDGDTLEMRAIFNAGTTDGRLRIHDNDLTGPNILLDYIGDGVQRVLYLKFLYAAAGPTWSLLTANFVPFLLP